MAHTFHATVLREYDIRGIIGETLGPDDARAIGRGFGTLLRRAEAEAKGDDAPAPTVAVSHTITGAACFAAYSMDVKFEGKSVTRHLDLMTSNHASYPGSTPPFR